MKNERQEAEFSPQDALGGVRVYGNDQESMTNGRAGAARNGEFLAVLRSVLDALKRRFWAEKGVQEVVFEG